MVRTQIQLPDDVYRELKALAEAKEWSLAEAVRRGVELLLRSYPADPTPKAAWSLPEPLPLGEFLAPVEDWRRLANERER
jgi:hypothetical protein